MLGLLLWKFLNFLRQTWITINFPPRATLAACHRFWIVVFLFSFVSGYFWFPLWFLQWYTGCLVASTSLCFLQAFFLVSELTQSCPVLCNPMDCTPPGSSIHGIFQTRVLEWVAISFFRGSSQPREWTQVSCIAGRLFTVWAKRCLICFQAS